MNLAIVGNLYTKQIDAIIGLDEKGNLGYISRDNELDLILDMLTNNNYMDIKDFENINNNHTVINKSYKKDNAKYLLAINDMLVSPWKILAVRGLKSDLNSALEESYDLLEGYYEQEI